LIFFYLFSLFSVHVSKRYNLNIILAQRHAIQLKTPVIVWRHTVKGDLVDAMSRRKQLDALYTLDSGLVGIFVKGAPVQITENVQVTASVVNGSCGELHSIVLPEHLTFTQKREYELLIRNAAPGEIVWLPCPIDTINFLFTGATDILYIYIYI